MRLLLVLVFPLVRISVAVFTSLRAVGKHRSHGRLRLAMLAEPSLSKCRDFG